MRNLMHKIFHVPGDDTQYHVLFMATAIGVLVASPEDPFWRVLTALFFACTSCLGWLLCEWAKLKIFYKKQSWNGSTNALVNHLESLENRDTKIIVGATKGEVMYFYVSRW